MNTEDWAVIVSYRPEWSKSCRRGCCTEDSIWADFEMARVVNTEEHIVAYIVERLLLKPEAPCVHMIFASFEDVLAYSQYGSLDEGEKEYSIIMPQLDSYLFLDEEGEPDEEARATELQKYEDKIYRIQQAVRVKLAETIQKKEEEKKAEEIRKKEEEAKRREREKMERDQREYERLKKQFEGPTS